MKTKSDFNILQTKHVQFLQQLLGSENVFLDQETLMNYGHDFTEDLCFPPDVLVKPSTVEQISKLLIYANEENLPIIPIGGRTGLSGGMLSVFGGIGLSMEKFNQIIEIDERNLQVKVQPGVITQVLQDAVALKGLYYPPDPSSKGSCFIGGNLAESAGGAHAVKYGITKDYVLNLEVVLPTGEIIQTGANTIKNSTGYNLTQLMVGSEGTLGIITQATLKLIPMPTHAIALLIPFKNAEDACDAVSAILNAKIVPAALEFMEKDAIVFGQKYLGIDKYPTEGIGGHLLIEVDGNYPEVLMTECEQIADVVSKFETGEILFADTEEARQELWKLRRCLGHAVKGTTVYKEEDTVVPRAELAKLLKKVKETSVKYGFQSVCYGHAGDGNLHINIIRNELSDEVWNNELPKAIREIFEYTVLLKGTLSGEHGIGYVQKNYMDIAFSDVELMLMKKIKLLFDPNEILNPGKIFV